MKDLFASLAAFKTLVNHPGWILFEEILNANIEIVKDQLETGTGEEETKESIDRLRDKLKVYREVRDTPKSMISKLESQEDEIPVTDPFSTVEDLQKDRMEKETKS